MFIAKVIENTFYNVDFLKSKGTSSQFFDQISYPVQLNGTLLIPYKINVIK